MNTPPDNHPQRDDFSRPEETTRLRRAILATATVRRAPPDASHLARRSALLRRAKWILPALALALLASIAIWPEMDRLINSNKTTLKELAKVKIESGNLVGVTYRGVDEHNRPFMITADNVRQGHDSKLNLTNPQADILTSGGTWLLAHAQHGIYMQHAQILDLTGDVTLYRNDGLMMLSPVADIDIRRGIIVSNTWVRAEGPFGTLDANGYLLSQHDGIAQFRGPGRLILNDDRNSQHAQNEKAP